MPQDKVERLQRETQAYADSVDPILSWSASEKMARSYDFIRGSLIPRRQSVVSLAQELSALNAQNLELERVFRERGQVRLQRFITNFMWTCLGLGFVIATLSIWRVSGLERQNMAEHQRAEQAQREQRRLAAKVMQAQEEERKRISLELHDALGQMASALGMELGRLETARHASPDQFHSAVTQVKQMNSDIVRAIRELATGLRPAMLDDLGLGPALRAHAREFSRRMGVPVDVRLDGEVERVPEPQRTSIYRIVQEALNNCGRHAHAKHAIVSLYGREDLVNVTIQDDGVGFDMEERSKSGLGLIGIRERVRDLAGSVKILSKPGHGTLIEVELPTRIEVDA